MNDLKTMNFVGWIIYADFGHGSNPHGKVTASEFNEQGVTLHYTKGNLGLQQDYTLHRMVWNHKLTEDKGLKGVTLTKRPESYQDAGLNPPRLHFAQTITLTPPPPR